jgi:hypothetical protein
VTCGEAIIGLRDESDPASRQRFEVFGDDTRLKGAEVGSAKLWRSVSQ